MDMTSYYCRFIRVLEILVSPGILFWHFPGLEIPGNRLTVVKTFSLKTFVCSIIFVFLFRKGLLLQLLCIGRPRKINLSPGEVLEKSWKSPWRIVSEKGYEACTAFSAKPAVKFMASSIGDKRDTAAKWVRMLGFLAGFRSFSCFQL